MTENFICETSSLAVYTYFDIKWTKTISVKSQRPFTNLTLNIFLTMPTFVKKKKKNVFGIFFNLLIIQRRFLNINDSVNNILKLRIKNITSRNTE